MATTKFSYTETNLNDMGFTGYKENIKISTGIIQPENSPLGKVAIKVNLSSNFQLERKSGIQVSTISINVGQEIILQPFLSTNYMPTNQDFIKAFMSRDPDNDYPWIGTSVSNVIISSFNTGGGLIQGQDLNKCTYPGDMSVTVIGADDGTIFEHITNNKIPISTEFVDKKMLPEFGLPFVLSTCPSANISTKEKPYYQTISTLAAYTQDVGVGLHLTTTGIIGPRFIGNPKTYKTNSQQGVFKGGGISFGEPLNVLGISKIYSLNGNMPLLGVISNQPDIEKHLSLQFNKSIICGGSIGNGYNISLSTTNLSVAGPNGSNIATSTLYWELHKGDIIGVCHIDPYDHDWSKGTFQLGTLVVGTSVRLSKITFMNELQSSLSDTPSKYPEYCNNVNCIGEPLVFSSTESREYAINITSKHVPWIADPFIQKASTPALYSILMRMEFVDLLDTKKINFKADSTSVKTIKLDGTSKTLPFTETIKY